MLRHCSKISGGMSLACINSSESPSLERRAITTPATPGNESSTRSTTALATSAGVAATDRDAVRRCSWRARRRASSVSRIFARSCSVSPPLLIVVFLSLSNSISTGGQVGDLSGVCEGAICETSHDPQGHPRMKSRAQSAGEEIANSLTHGVGVLLTLIVGPVLVMTAVGTGDPWRIVASATYATTLLFLFTSSMLYHALRSPEAKQLFRRIDHSAIYLLIAGTYTPFTLITLRGPWGWTLFGLIWGLAILGITLKVVAMGRFRGLSLALYIGMGWLVVVALRPLTAALAQGGMVLLVLGGIAYTSGVLFYVWRRLPYHHAYWHAFVLAGSVLHFFAILLYVVPGRS